MLKLNIFWKKIIENIDRIELVIYMAKILPHLMQTVFQFLGKNLYFCNCIDEIHRCQLLIFQKEVYYKQASCICSYVHNFLECSLFLFSDHKQ